MSVKPVFDYHWYGKGAITDDAGNLVQNLRVWCCLLFPLPFYARHFQIKAAWVAQGLGDPMSFCHFGKDYLLRKTYLISSLRGKTELVLQLTKWVSMLVLLWLMSVNL